jgi:peptidoglycan/xylan/chitin deacetylase (PgdA/CDA1 family)
MKRDFEPIQGASDFLTRPITRRAALGIIGTIATGCVTDNRPPLVTITTEPIDTPKPSKKRKPTLEITPSPTPDPTEPFERNVEGLVYPGDLIMDDTPLIPEGIVCIDIDDGIYPEENARMLEITDTHGDKAPLNLFYNSKYYDSNHEANQQALREIVARRVHAIENHTDTHPFLTQIRSGRVKSQLERQQRELSKVLGTNLVEYFLKPPYLDLFIDGKIDEDVRLAARDLGLAIILGGIDPKGYEMVNSSMNFEDQVQRIVNRVKRGLKNDASMNRGSHVTLHSNANDIEALAGIIEYALSEGYKIKTLRDVIPLARRDSRVVIPTPTPNLIFEPTPSGIYVPKTSGQLGGVIYRG